MPALAQQALGNYGGSQIVSSSTYSDTGFDTAALGQVYRGVAIAPVPLRASAWLLLGGLGGLGIARRKRQSV